MKLTWERGGKGGERGGEIEYFTQSTEVHPYLCIILSLYTSLDSQHLPESVLVAMANLELLPRLPVGLARPRVTHLRTMAENPSSSINLTQLSLQLRILHTHLSIVKKKKQKQLAEGV